MASVQELQHLGWYVSEDGLKECASNGQKTVDDIIKVALNLDLKHIGERHLPDGINRCKSDTLDGPLVLQVVKVRNITAPKDNEESQVAPPLLKVTLTDGHSNSNGLELDKVPKLSLHTPPGTKIVLRGKISVSNGFLLLGKDNTKLLGGHVEKLVENWELKRTLAKHTRSMVSTEGGGPPPFVPFGQRYRDPNTRDLKPKRDNFKSLQDKEKDKKEKEEDKEFEAQRQASIAEALQSKGGEKKTFGGTSKPNDKSVASIVEMGFSVDQATSALRQTNGNVEAAISALIGGGDQRRSDGRGSDGSHRRDDRLDNIPKASGRGGRGAGRGGGRGGDKGGDKEGDWDQEDGRRGRGRRRDEEEMSVARPSGPATLFDFLTDKFPTSAGNKEPPTSAGGNMQLGAGEDRNKSLQNLPPRLQRQQQRQDENRSSRGSGRGRGGGQGTNTDWAAEEDVFEGQRGSSGGGGGGPGRGRGGRGGRSERGGKLDRSGRDRGQQSNSWPNAPPGEGRSGQSRDGRRSHDNENRENRGPGGNRQRRGGDQGDKRGGQGWEAGPDNILIQRGPREQNQADGRGRRNQQYQQQQPYHQRGNQQHHQHNEQHYEQQYEQRGGNQGNRQERGNFQQFMDGANMYTDSNRNTRGGGGRDHRNEQRNDQRSQPRQHHQHQQHQQHHQQQQQQYHHQQQPRQNRSNASDNNFNPALDGVRQPYMDQVTPSSSNESERPSRQWKSGDYCMAKYWEDNKFYRAMIHAMAGNGQTCVITFPDYGNAEEVFITDIRPIPKHAWDARGTNTNQSGGSTPSSASMNPASYSAQAIPALVTSSMGYMSHQYSASDQPSPPHQQQMQPEIPTMEFHAGGGGVSYAGRRGPQQLYVPPSQR